MITFLAFPGSELFLEIDEGRFWGENVINVLITLTASCGEEAFFLPFAILRRVIFRGAKENVFQAMW